MRPVTRAMLEDMPDPSDLHLEQHGGRCLVMVGSAVLAEYAKADTVMRNFAVTVLRRAGFSGKRVAEVFGLSAAYVSTLHAAAQRDGSAALVKHDGPGRPAELGAEDLGQARAWRAAGVSDREIGRRLGVAGTTIGRQLGPRDPAAAAQPGRQDTPGPAEPLVSEEEARAGTGEAADHARPDTVCGDDARGGDDEPVSAREHAPPLLLLLLTMMPGLGLLAAGAA
jgi:hypothetical protein